MPGLISIKDERHDYLGSTVPQSLYRRLALQVVRIVSNLLTLGLVLLGFSFYRTSLFYDTYRNEQVETQHRVTKAILFRSAIELPSYYICIPPG